MTGAASTGKLDGENAKGYWREIPRVQREPDEYVDQHALGDLIMGLVGQTVGELPVWVLEFSACS